MLVDLAKCYHWPPDVLFNLDYEELEFWHDAVKED